MQKVIRSRKNCSKNYTQHWKFWIFWSVIPIFCLYTCIPSRSVGHIFKGKFIFWNLHNSFTYYLYPIQYTAHQQKLLFLSLLTQSHCWQNIYWWSLRQRYFENIDMYAQFCPKLEDYRPCNHGVVCPTTPASPIFIDSKYNTMDHQWCSNERPNFYL